MLTDCLIGLVVTTDVSFSQGDVKDLRHIEHSRGHQGGRLKCVLI